MEAAYKWEMPQKQPAAAIMITIAKSLTGIFKSLWPVLLAVLVSGKKENRSEKLLFISLIILILGLIYAALEFFFFRFFITGKELVIKKGFFNKREIVLPLDRIQAVHLDQDWLHRLLNIVKITVDSPGSSKAEVKFSLKRDMAEALRSFILAEGNSQNNEPRETVELTRPAIVLSGSDIIKLGISSNFLKAFFIMLAFLISMLDNLEGITGKQSADWMLWAGDQASASSAGVIAGFATMVLLLSVAVSFVMVVLKYGNFRMDKINKGFHIKTGLLNRREKVVPFAKVQFISWKANWIRRHIPYYMMKFHAIGDKEKTEKLDISVPVTRLAFFEPLLENYHPLVKNATTTLRIHPSYTFRKTLIVFYVCFAIFTGLWFIADKYAFLVFAILPVFALSYFIFRKKFRADISATAVQVNREIFGKEAILLRWDKIQSVTVVQSIFQRRKDLATIKLNTAGGILKIPFIPLGEAKKIRDYAIYVVENLSEPAEEAA
ncbi:MAG: hypothetical protein EOO01_01725 [Chitinophagaceae bacterium]|nr:MAG: hypothetical protein EOO01_01725 [Chitinophagaceae bacterium]